MDYKHFSRAVHADLVAILRPRPIFLGLIRDWVDVDLRPGCVTAKRLALCINR